MKYIIKKKRVSGWSFSRTHFNIRLSSTSESRKLAPLYTFPLRCEVGVETTPKRPLGRPRRRWKHNIKMDLQEVGGGCGDWMELAPDRDRWRALVSTVRNLRVPKIRVVS